MSVDDGARLLATDPVGAYWQAANHAARLAARVAQLEKLTAADHVYTIKPGLREADIEVIPGQSLLVRNTTERSWDVCVRKDAIELTPATGGEGEG
jgi:hypothetical protein